jgi:hypothetical protein
MLKHRRQSRRDTVSFRILLLLTISPSALGTMPPRTPIVYKATKNAPASPARRSCSPSISGGSGQRSSHRSYRQARTPTSHYCRGRSQSASARCNPRSCPLAPRRPQVLGPGRARAMRQTTRTAACVHIESCNPAPAAAASCKQTRPPSPCSRPGGIGPADGAAGYNSNRCAQTHALNCCPRARARAGGPAGRRAGQNCCSPGWGLTVAARPAR